MRTTASAVSPPEPVLALKAFARYLEGAPDATLVVDADGIIRVLNAQAGEMFGYPVEELVGQAVECLVPDRVRPYHPRLRAGHAPHGHRPVDEENEVTGRHRDGHAIPVEITLGHIETDAGAMTVAAIRDVTEIRRAEQRLREAEERYRHLAEHDSLTGLMNRRRFETELEAHLAICRQTHGRARDRGALLSVDLDDFKAVNDALGHHVGDQLVTAVAHALRTTVHDRGVVGRQGGDEFLVLVREGGEAEAADVAGELLEAVAAAARIVPEAGIRVAGSVGAVVLGRLAAESLTVEATMIAADTALYAAKAAGRGRAAFHHELAGPGTRVPAQRDMSV